MSKTPETDGMSDVRLHSSEWQRFARKLEIERDEAREKLRKLEVENDHNWQANEMAEQAFRERDEAREQLKWKQHRVEVLQRVGSKLVEQRNRLAEELETERIRLAACGVVALADTTESAARAREMLPKYHSASLGDVIRRVDECMVLREQRDRLAEALDTLTLVVGLTPIAGNKDTLQEAMDIARAAFAAVKESENTSDQATANK